MLYTRDTIEYRDSTLAAIVPAAVGIDGRLDDSGIAETGSRPSARSTTSLRIRFPRAILLVESWCHPPGTSTATWHTEARDRHRSPMRASEVTGSAASLTFPGQRAEDGRFFKGWSPSLEQPASRWRFRS